MDTQDKVNLDFHLKVHEQAASSTNNLQTALFTTFTIVIGSAIIGILLGFKDLSTSLSQALGYPGILIIIGALWGIALFLVAVATYIFIACTVYGFRIIQIENDFYGKPISYGEIENFVPNDEANFLHLISTHFYYPGLLASGYSHKYFPPLFILTLILVVIIATAQYFLLNFAIFPDSNTIYYTIHLFLISYSFPLSVLACLFFLIICMVVVPIFTPNSQGVAHNIKHNEILVISETLSYLHGTEISVIGFAKNAIQMGKSTLIVGPIERGGKTVREKCEQSKIPIVQLPFIGAWFLGQPDFRLAIPFLLKLIISDKTKYIFINAFPGPLALLGLILGRLQRKKVIFYYNVYLPKFSECIPLIGKTKFVKYFFEYVTCKFSNMCNLVVAPSEVVFNEMIEWGVMESKIKIVPMGIDPFFIDPSSHEEIMKIKNAYSFPLILYVGRLSQEKNIELLISAFDRVLEKYSSATLVIVGRGPEERKLKKLVRKLELEKFVEFKGFLDWQNLKPLYWAADVFCMPSLGETQGLSILEAKACQRPCVVLNKVGAGEQIENEVDGLIVDEKENIKETALAFALAIDKILSDKNLSARIGKEARSRAIQKTIDLSTKELIQLFEKIPNESVKTPNSDAITSMESLSSFVTTNLRYLKEAYFGSVNTKIHSDGLKADLHVHPCITNLSSLKYTLDVMVRNRCSLLALTVHDSSNSKEKDFWQIKEWLYHNAKDCDIEEFEDMNVVLKLYYRRKNLYLIPAYENYCVLEGLGGKLDLVIIGAEQQFISQFKKKEDFESKVKVARKYGGIVIASHPYTIWDPHGPKNFIKFRLATPSERRIIRSNVFPNVDCVDLVATNCAWMIKSNELVLNEYSKKPLCCSDAHAINKSVRREIGKSGCIFKNEFEIIKDGIKIREYIREQIISGEFITFLSYLRPIKFVRSIALFSPSNKHP